MTDAEAGTLGSRHGFKCGPVWTEAHIAALFRTISTGVKLKRSKKGIKVAHTGEGVWRAFISLGMTHVRGEEALPFTVSQVQYVWRRAFKNHVENIVLLTPTVKKAILERQALPGYGRGRVVRSTACG